MAAGEGPTVRRRRLGIELARRREAAGLTQEQVAHHFEWHPTKVNRIENARVRVTARDVKDMLGFYGVADEQLVEALAELARRSGERTWVTNYRDVLRGSFVALEAEAASVHTWEPGVVPGLLQTADYTRALYKAGRPASSAAEIDRRVDLRMTRQAALAREANPLALWAIIDESVLHAAIGGERVMRAQLRRLVEAAEPDHVTVQVLPFAAGAHAFTGWPVTILEFPEFSDLNVVYFEGLLSDSYEDEPAEVKRHKREFERLRAMALSPADSVAKIAELADSGA